MKVEELQKKLLEYEEQMKVLNKDIENYKNIVTEKDNTIKEINDKYNEEVAKYSSKINDLQTINQQYFLKLMNQDKQVNNIEIETVKQQKFSNGLDFNDFINQL